MSGPVTFSNVYASDSSRVGFRAVDLAFIHGKKYLVPPSFVIPVDTFDEFVEMNGFKNKIGKLLSETTPDSYSTFYEEIRKLFLSGDLPEDTEAELVEIYSTLSLDVGDADKLVSRGDDPVVNIIPSHTYLVSEDDATGVILGIKGVKNFLKAIKLCWASIYHPGSMSYREDSKLGHDVSLGVIVQALVPADASAIGYEVDENIIVRPFFGVVDMGQIVTKDEYILTKEYLRIEDSKKKHQEFKMLFDEGAIVKHYLKEKGLEAKMTEKEIMEIARLTKRLGILLKKPLRIFCSIKNLKVYVLLAASRIKVKEPEKKQDVEEAAEVIEPIVEDASLEQDLEFYDEVIAEEPVEEVKEHFETEDDFIMPSEVPVLKKDPLEEAYSQVRDALQIMDGVVTEALSKKYRGSATDFETIINDVKENMRVPYEMELQRIHELVDSLSDADVEEVTSLLKSASKFLEEFG